MAIFTNTNVNSITGTAAADIILIGAPADALTSMIADAGSIDELRFTGTTGQTPALDANLSNSNSSPSVPQRTIPP